MRIVFLIPGKARGCIVGDGRPLRLNNYLIGFWTDQREFQLTLGLDIWKQNITTFSMRSVRTPMSAEGVGQLVVL